MLLRLPVLICALAALWACGGGDLEPGTIEGPGRAARDRSAGEAGGKRILFGDLHVHTTYSIDAYLYALPIFASEGVHPPADACDFARYCSSLDFFSLNDHAEGLTPERWTRSLESLRECDARAGDPADPDLVAFAGWEWTQAGTTPEGHFGHKNVIFPGLGEDELPARAITSLPDDIMRRAPNLWLIRALQTIGFVGLSEYADFLWWIERLAGIPNCESGVDTRALPPDCRENAPTPEVLFEKLAQWGLPTLVIPHGLAWGIHAPPASRLDNQLRGGRTAPEVQRLLEVYSGHGNSEVFRAEAARAEWAVDASGQRVCPAPTAEFLPCCWRAGEIVRERCGDLPESECGARVAEARQLALEAGRRPHWVIPDASPEDWLDCDQCRDCFKPTLSLRPGETAQYGLAISSFEKGGRPERFRFGLIASSDTHSARAGSGYKQLGRKGMSDARGLRSERLDRWLGPRVAGSQDDPRRAQPAPEAPQGFRNLLDVERGASFLYPGGLVAAHADGRGRRAVWDALLRREVYGTSGPRILLWFDLLNAPGEPVPMGGETEMAEAPEFEVRAVGSFVQKPGCPDETLTALSAERIEELCFGECYHPGDERHPIVAVEVVRIRPQAYPGEPVEDLIDDPWRRFACDGDPSGCVVRFADPDFAVGARDTVYYARALQEATPAINAANLRTTFDADGNPVRVDPCFGGYRTAKDDDCLAPAQERAWSSPIFVDFARAR